MDLPNVPGVRHRFLTVGSVRLHVAEAGDASAPPVLLLHGFPQHWYMWRHLMVSLAPTRHVIALDLRGFGWSDAPRAGYATRDRVRDVLAVMDELGVESADLVGHDWGALLAFRIALDHAERVDRLVAISMVHPWPLQRHLAPRVWRWWVTALFEWPWIGDWVLRTRPQVVAWLLRRDAVRPAVWTEELLAVYTDVFAEPGRARAGRRLHAQLVLSGIPQLLLGRDRRRRFEVPTLMIVGDHDGLVPPAVLTVPKGREDMLSLRTVEGGHFVVEENPTDVATAVLGQLSPVDQISS